MRGWTVPRIAAATVAGLLGAYLVIRGIAEFFTVNFSDPASYRNDWGGPSLAGVFAVHSGPGLAVLIAAAGYLIHARRVRRRRDQASRPPERAHATRRG